MAVQTGKSTRVRTKPDARIVKTQAALRDALIDLVAEQPFATVTIAAITERARVGYATFFRHYPGAEALLGEIADGLIGELLAQVAPLVLSNDIAGASLALTRFVAERRSLCQALLVGAGDAIRQDITARAIAAAGTAPSAMPDWLPRDLGIVHGVAATLTILAWWLEYGGAMDAVQAAILIERLVLTPLAKPD